LPMAQTSSILKDWAFKEMEYGGGWPDEKMVALCSGPMEEVWQWIVTHCKEREKVRMIRGNLALAARTRTGGIGKDKDLSVGTTGHYIADNSSVLEIEGSKELLMAERGRLLGDLHNTLAKVEKLKATVAEHNKDREKIVRTKAEWMNEMRLHQKRMTLLRLYTSQVSSGTSKIKEISQKVGKLVEIVKKIESQNSCHQFLGRESENEGCASVKRAVEIGLSYMKEKTKPMLGDGQAQTEGDVSNVFPSTATAKVEIASLLAGLPPALIFREMLELTERLTQKIKLQAQVTKVQTKEESDKLKKDLEIDDINSITVKKEMSNFCRKHLKSYFSATTAFESIAVVEEKIEALREKVPKTNYVNELEESERQKGILLKLHDSVRELGKEMRNPTLCVKAVKKQQAQIDCLAELISMLILRSNSYSFGVEQKSNLTTLQLKLPVEATRLVDQCGAMQSLPCRGLELLNAAPAELLTSTRVLQSSSPTSLLAIHRNIGGWPSLIMLQNCGHQDLLFPVIHSLERTEKKEEELRRCKKNFTTGDREKIEKTLNSLSVNIKEQMRNLMPLLDQGLETTKEIEKVLAAIEVVYSEWKQQPAEAVATDRHWGQLEGKTLKQMNDTVQVYIAELNC